MGASAAARAGDAIWSCIVKSQKSHPMIAVTFVLLALFQAPVYDLATADGLLAEKARFFAGGPTADIDGITAMYRNVLERTGPSVRAEAGLGECLLLTNHYAEAAAHFSNAMLAGKQTLAEHLARAQTLIGKVIPAGRTVLSVVPVSGSPGGWVSLDAFKLGWTSHGPPHTEEEYEFPPHLEGVRLRRWRMEGERVESIGASIPIESKDDKSQAVLDSALTSVQLGSSQGVLVYKDLLGGDSSPSEIDLYRCDAGGFAKLGSFYSFEDPKLVRDGSTGRLAIAFTPTWKIYWTDVYEWDGKGFVFANASYPSFFGPRPDPREDMGKDFTRWLVKAANQAMYKDWPGALRSLASAEHYCLLSMRYSGDPWETPYYPEYGFYGSATGILAQIRQRIRWIKAHDYSHILLYRPYDWDVFDFRGHPYQLIEGLK